MNEQTGPNLPESSDDELARDALGRLAESAPSVEADAIWSRLETSLDATPQAGGWHSRLAGLFATPLQRTVVAGAGAAALLVVAAVATPLLGNGGRADAALLDSARALSSTADDAFSDGELTDEELEELRAGAQRLLQLIVEDPSRLERLSSSDLADVIGILAQLEGDLVLSLPESASPIARIRSANGLATAALRGSNPSHPLLVSSSSVESDEQFFVATPGIREFPVRDIGSVTLDVRASSLTVVGHTAAAGSTFVVDRADGLEVEADFIGAGERVRFNAELEDGVLRIRIESRDGVSDDDDDRHDRRGKDDDDDDDEDEDRDRDESHEVVADGAVVSYLASTAGSVTVRRDGNTLVIEDVSPAAGWTVEIEDASGREVEVDFRRGNQRVKFDAEIEDGGIRVRVESRFGGSDSDDDDDDDRDDDDDDDDDRDDD